MTTYPDARAWLTAFRVEPDTLLDNLLRFGDSITPFQRGEPHDAALTALRAHGGGDDAGTLDRALAHWLEARLIDPLGAVDHIGWDAYVAYMIEGFTLAARLGGEETGALLRDRFETFDAWTSALSDEGPGDMNVRYLFALAHNQGTTRRFLGQWYRICDEAGRDPERRPAIHLTAALVGLSNLPAPDVGSSGGGSSAPESLEGLARWARHLPKTEEAHEDFVLEWHALTARHPRTTPTWATLTQDIREAYAGKPFVAWLNAELGIEAPPTGGGVKAPTKRDAEHLIGRFRSLDAEQLKREVLAFTQKHERYASATGDHYPLPRAFNIIGNALLDLKTPEAARLAGRLAATALEYDPNNEYNWVLKATAAAALGQRDVAESVLLRARERLPDNAHIRNTLAGLLAGWGRAGEAEALYRETMARLPDNEAAPTALAKLLADHGREGEAEALYRETMRRFEEDPVCRLDLGLLLIRQGRRDDVAPILAALDALRATEAKTLRAHYEGRVKADDWSAPPSSPLPVSRPTDAVGRALWAKFALTLPGRVKGLLLMNADEAEALRAEAERLLDEALRRDPHNPVVRLVARRYKKIDAASAPTDEEARRVAGKDYALRLELAQAGSDEDPFAWLFEDFPDANRRALTAVAWLHHTPTAKGHPQAMEAVAHLNRWLARDLPDDALATTAALHHGLKKPLFRFVGKADTFFVSGFGMLAPDAVASLIDIALLGLVLDAMPMADFAEEAAHETV